MRYIEENRFRLEITPLASEMQTPSIPGGVITTLSGNYESIFKGRGLEFRDFKEFGPIDDARRIDWKASLKTNKLLVKEFQEERNAEVIFCFDVSSGMIFGSGNNKLKNHYGAEFIVSLGKHIMDSGNLVGLITFTDKVMQFLPPEMSESQLWFMMDVLSSFSTYGGRNDFGEVLGFLKNHVLEGTTILLISDFFNFKRFKTYENILRILHKKFELIFVILRDPLEESFLSKKKPVLLFNPKTSLNILVRPSHIKKKYVQETQKEKNRLKNYLNALHIPFLELFTHQSFVAPLTGFFTHLEVDSYR